MSTYTGVTNCQNSPVFWPTLYIYCHLQYLEMQRQNRKLCTFKIANDAVRARCRDETLCHSKTTIKVNRHGKTDFKQLSVYNTSNYTLKHTVDPDTQSILIHME